MDGSNWGGEWQEISVVLVSKRKTAPKCGFETLYVSIELHTNRIHFLHKPLERRMNTVFWWRFTDSNRGPVDYDSIALTD